MRIPEKLTEEEAYRIKKMIESTYQHYVALAEERSRKGYKRLSEKYTKIAKAFENQKWIIEDWFEFERKSTNGEHEICVDRKALFLRLSKEFEADNDLKEFIERSRRYHEKVEEELRQREQERQEGMKI